jgi:prevent-host-death family protein
MDIAIRSSPLSRRVSIADARNHLTRLLREIERGETIELTRHGRPVAALVSISELRRLREGRPDFWTALETFRESHDLEGLAECLDDLRDTDPGREVEL